MLPCHEFFLVTLFLPLLLSRNRLNNTEGEGQKTYSGCLPCDKMKLPVNLAKIFEEGLLCQQTCLV